MFRLAELYEDRDRPEEAERLFRDVLAERQRTIGDDHPDTLASMNRLALHLRFTFRLAEAEKLYLELLETRRRVYGSEQAKGTLLDLAGVYGWMGRHNDAEQLYLEYVEATKRAYGESHVFVLGSLDHLVEAYLFMGSREKDEQAHQELIAKAEQAYQELIETAERVFGDSPEHTEFVEGNQGDLAELYELQGRLEEAEQLRLEILEREKRLLGDDHNNTLVNMQRLASLYERQGRQDEVVEELNRELIDSHRRVYGDDHPSTLYFMNELARLLLRREPASSRNPETALQLALDVAEKTGHKNPDYLDTLALAYYQTGDTALAIETQKKAVSLLPVGESPDRTELEERLAEFEAALGSED